MTVATADYGRLVLSRKVGERIWIAPNIWITVHQVRGDKARIMVEVPKDVSIFREECLEPEDRYGVVIEGNPPEVPEEQPLVEADAAAPTA